jgi:hypothetical protein
MSLSRGVSMSEEEIVIDLSLLKEGFMTMLSAKIERLLNVLLTGAYFPASIKGTPRQIDRFTSALAAEKKYITAFNQYGLNNPATYKSRYQLDRAVKKFERDTGLVWPFK